MNPLRPGDAAQALAHAWGQAANRRPLFATCDRDCAQDLVSRVFRPHRLEPRRGAGGSAIAARMDYLPLGMLNMSHLRYGGDVDILPGPLESFYLLQIPIRGHAQIDSGGTAFVSDPGCAALLSPQPDLRMRWQAGNEQLLVRMETATVQRFAQAWSGRPDLPAPVFDPRLRLDAQPAVQDALLALLAFNAAQGEPPDDPGRYALSAAQLQHRLVAALLSGHPHDQGPALAGSGPPLAPRSVRAVEDYLVSHIGEPLTPQQLAAHAGVSVRSLFLGFQRYRGVSPMRLLRELRLRRAHDELLGAAPGAQVTDVALRWGFCHLGRFGQEYRAAFGESPRDTLRAALRA